mgnify:CR=1 FL=1
MNIHPETRMGPVHYTVANLARQIAFYTDILGFKLRWQEGDEASLGTDERELLRLTAVPGAKRHPRTTGLYHTAFLVPTRWDLAHLMRRLLETGVPLHGTSNHGTHLAIYLPDPEGNGIELAWDFPREVWPMKNGRMDFGAMPRQGIDLAELFTELERDGMPWTGLPADTVVGHVHLHVADLQPSRAFYHEILGFDVTLDGEGMGALFVSAGGYHHHIGMNVWKGVGLPPAPPDAVGLRYYTVLLPNRAELERVGSLLKQADVELTERDDGILVRDPSQIGILFRVM